MLVCQPNSVNINICKLVCWWNSIFGGLDTCNRRAMDQVRQGWGLWAAKAAVQQDRKNPMKTVFFVCLTYKKKCVFLLIGLSQFPVYIWWIFVIWFVNGEFVWKVVGWINCWWLIWPTQLRPEKSLKEDIVLAAQLYVKHLCYKWEFSLLCWVLT